jgi:hypothetical protein
MNSTMPAHTPLLRAMRYSLALLASLVFSTAAPAQSAAPDPNIPVAIPLNKLDPSDPVVIALKNLEASELLPFKDFCQEKYPQFASTYETQLKEKLQDLYGPNYAAKVKKLVASRQYKADMRNTLISFNAWPDSVSLSRCEKLQPSVSMITSEVIEVLRQGMQDNLTSLTNYARACSLLYPNEKFSQIMLDEQIESVYGEGPQAQRKYAAFLAKPDVKAELADKQQRFDEDRGRSDYRLLDQCFSAERRKSGVTLPAKRP